MYVHYHAEALMSTILLTTSDTLSRAPSTLRMGVGHARPSCDGRWNFRLGLAVALVSSLVAGLALAIAVALNWDDLLDAMEIAWRTIFGS